MPHSVISESTHIISVLWAQNSVTSTIKPLTAKGQAGVMHCYRVHRETKFTESIRFKNTAHTRRTNLCAIKGLYAIMFAIETM